MHVDAEFEGALRRLAASADGEFPSDVDDEHQRWDLYRRAMRIDACRADLLHVVSLDPDAELSLSVVLQMLEIEDAPARGTWLAVLSDERRREYASRRARELGVLEEFGQIPGLSAAVVATWSDWLQIRLAEVSKVSDVLLYLEKHGRTRRIRRTAVERRKTL